MTFAKKLKRFWWILAIPVLALLCYFVATRIVNTVDYKTNSIDFVAFWLAGNLVANGQSLYDATLWVDGYAQSGAGARIDHSFLYPLPLAFFFAPLGLLSLRAANIVWVTITLLIILGVTLALTLTSESPKAKLMPVFILIGIVFFRPTTLVLFTGPVTGLLLILLAGSLFCFEGNKTFWGGFLLALLMLKPNLGAVIIPLMSIWFLRQKFIHAFWGMAAAGLFMLIAGLLYNPHWLTEYWQVGTGKLTQTFGFSPTVWGLAHLACGYQQSCTLPVGGVAAVILTGVVLWQLVRLPNVTPLNAFSLSTTLTLLITPYLWTYDQLLLLIPIAAFTFFLGDRKGGFLLAAFFFLALDLIAIFVLVFDTILQVEILNGIIPLAVFISLWHSTRQQTHPPSFGY